MKRREFIQKSSALSLLSLMPFHNVFSNSLLGVNGVKKLIVIELEGGNDGLNTLVPFNNDIYYRSRPNIALNRKDLLTISDELGFNKNLGFFEKLYKEGNLSILNSVGYEKPNRSHFRARDIMHTASSSDEYLSEGWLAQYLEKNNKNISEAIFSGNELNMALKGAEKSALSFQNVDQFYQMANNGVLKNYKYLEANDKNLNFINDIIRDSKKASEKFSKVNKSKLAYSKDNFGQQLKNIAGLIKSNVDSSIFYAELGSFDTHVNQIQKQGNLFKNLSKNIEFLVEDLKSADAFDDTLILVFSEFGRRVKSNASKGTDHGTANQMYIIGGALQKSGLYNKYDDLEDLYEGIDLKHKIDFRQVYSTILDKHLGVDSKKVLGAKFENLNFI